MSSPDLQSRSRMEEVSETVAADIVARAWTLEPLEAPHLQSFILLHGSGDTGANFGWGLANKSIVKVGGGSSSSSSSSSITSNKAKAAAEEEEIKSLRAMFPHARFVFPTAPMRVCERYSPVRMTRWFDWWSLEQPEEREDVQEAGLRACTDAVHALIRREAAALLPVGGTANVVLGGISNGCGQSITSLLLWPGEPLAAYLGMCGWLPYAAKLKQRAENGAKAGGDNNNNNNNNEMDAVDPTSWLASEIKWEKTQGEETAATAASSKSKNLTPVFLGHGDDDYVVPLDRMFDLKATLEKLGYKIESKVYPGLGHWYSDAMLGDMVSWLQPRLPEPTSAKVA